MGRPGLTLYDHWRDKQRARRPYHVHGWSCEYHPETCPAYVFVRGRWVRRSVGRRFEDDIAQSDAMHAAGAYDEDFYE